MATATDTHIPRPDLSAIVAHASSLLPQQAPLHAFVHHNTLHHLEHLPFEQAVVEAAEVMGTEPFPSEGQFAEHLRSGRILGRDIASVIAQEQLGEDTPLFDQGPTGRAFRQFRLEHLFEIPRGQTLSWILEEGEAISTPRPDLSDARRQEILALGAPDAVLPRLWNELERVAPALQPRPAGVRWRDRLLTALGRDTDDWVHPLLIRCCAAFVDQGISYWPLPDRALGFLRAMRRLYGQSKGPPTPWCHGLSEALRKQEREDWSATRTAIWALDEGGVLESEYPEFIQRTLLSLRGWAAMMHQLERHPERAPVAAPPARLMDYLAVQLVLDLFAARSACRERNVDLPDALASGRRPAAPPTTDRSLVYEAFVLAQYSSVPLLRFAYREVAEPWLRAVADCDSMTRRRVLLLAYERRHRVEVLDALALLKDRSPRPGGPRSFQAIFCIDDREESLRRHLEEIDPACETFGYAGFFGVAMSYKGLDDIRFQPLCPVVISPKHLIEEIAQADDSHERYRTGRRRRARVQNAGVVGARTLVRGGLISSLLGPLTIVPLVGRTLFPRTAHRLSGAWGGLGVTRPRTRLAFEADLDVDVDDALQRGYRESEMAEIVESAFRSMGLDATHSSLVIVVGHGSSSLNNPHEAAHDCGATGGGRGGPNARAFAAMANHPRVRDRLREKGIDVPDSTIFVGAYHNTCDDSMQFYDEDMIPASHDAALEHAKGSLGQACRRDAHERCRRFETAPFDIDLDRALEEVEEHAVDLAQPRPEYGHATNAICFVGRRELTRGLFLDRRAFLVSYDPTTDPDGALLAPLLMSVGPVGAGINLEYYFSYVDPNGYGSGTKLPHNITGLLGVMDGHSSDLRTGLPWQMVEIHEPVRMLTIVDVRPDVLLRILDEHPPLEQLVANRWIQMVTQDPETAAIHVYENGDLRPYEIDASCPDTAVDSRSYYAGHREHLRPAWLTKPGVHR